MKSSESEIVKLVVVAPLSHADQIRQALADSGAGVIGKYHHCSFAVVGVGRSIPGEGAQPFIGTVGQPEQITEERIETPCPRSILPQVIKALKAAHPYEEPVIEVYPMIDISELE